VNLTTIEVLQRIRYAEASGIAVLTDADDTKPRSGRLRELSRVRA
jgi:hypothetical protein